MKHGGSARDSEGRSPRLYRAWLSMRGRCSRPTHDNYRWYGGRGIRVCDEWADFAAFARDMGPHPGADYTLDRIDSAGNYEPDNCRWATRFEQQRHRDDNHKLTYGGETLCVAEWAERLGVKPVTLYARVAKGWGAARALTTPVRQWGKNR